MYFSMDGVFVFKTMKKLLILAMAVTCFLLGIFCADRKAFVSHWNDPQDVHADSLQQAMEDASDLTRAKEFILGFLPRIDDVACAALDQLGWTQAELLASDAVDSAYDREGLQLHWYVLELWERIEKFLSNR